MRGGKLADGPGGWAGSKKLPNPRAFKREREESERERERERERDPSPTLVPQGPRAPGPGARPRAPGLAAAVVGRAAAVLAMSQGCAKASVSRSS